MSRLTHYPWQAGSLPENLFTLGYLGLRADAVQLTFRTSETQQRPCQTVSSQQKKGMVEINDLKVVVLQMAESAKSLQYCIAEL